MQFINYVKPDVTKMFNRLGYKGQKPDEATLKLIEQAGTALQETAEPRYIFKEFPLPFVLTNSTNQPLPNFFTGRDIKKHLEGCESIILLAVTLGVGVDTMLRAEGMLDMRKTLLLDTYASLLIEEYTKETESLVCEYAAEKGLYATSRYSPGYGDFPLAAQQETLRLLDAGKQIGLSATENGLLLPVKSITGVMGLSLKPLPGLKTGCNECTLHGKCSVRNRGYCYGKENNT